MRKDCTIALLALVCQLAIGQVAARSGEDQWVWRTYSRKERAFREKDIDRSAAIRSKKQDLLRREPTTRRPLPGEPENDEIEDYVDVEPTATPPSTVGTRQFNPYGGGNPFGGFGGQPSNGGQFSGIGGYGGGSPGVLVGPGGPTGIIGRPPAYPNLYQPGFGGAQNGLGLSGYPGGYGASGAGYPGLGVGGGYPGVGAATGFPGGQLGGAGGLGAAQFPGAGSQFPFGSYPGAGASYNNNQFGTPGGQFPPGLGQYPSNQYAGPQYTEGYGLASPGLGQGGLPPTGFGGNFGAGGFGFDEKAPNLAEGKSARNVDVKPSTVNDKLNKKI